MDEAIDTLVKTWNGISQWIGRNTNLNLPNHLDVPKWLQHLIIFCALYSTFSITSSYYLLLGSRRPIKRVNPVTIILLKLRIFVALCLATCPVIQLLIKVQDNVVTWVDVTVCGFMMYGWLVHQQYLRLVETEMSVHHSGHVAVNLSWILTVTALIYQICFTFYDKISISGSSLEDNWDFKILSASGVCQVCYFLILLASLIHVGDGTYTQKFDVQAAVKRSGCAVTNSVTNLFSSLTFGWVNKLMDKGVNHQLVSANDLVELPPHLQSHHVDKIFMDVYERLKIKAKKKIRPTDHKENKTVKTVPLFEALVQCFGYQYFLLGFLKLATDCIGFVAPVLLNKLLTYLESDGILKSQAYYYAFCLCVCSLVTTLLNSQFFYLIYQVALKVRAAIIMVVYRKLLTTSANEMTKLNLGELVNFMSNDADRIINFCPNFHNLWSLPLQILICIYLLYTQVEGAVVCGMVFGLIMIYTNYHIARKIANLSDKMMGEKDARVNMMSETLHGINSVKFNAWEKHFINWISNLRGAEIKSQSGRKYLNAICVYFWATSTLLISFLTFFAYVYLFGKALTTAKVFTSLALINILLLPLNVFPWTVNGLMEAWVSLKRIEKLLELPEINRKQLYTKPSESTKRSHIQIKEGIFLWAKSQHSEKLPPNTSTKKQKKKPRAVSPDHQSKPKKFILGPLNLDVQEGQFIGIFGQVGSGKTSLLHAIMGEMRKISGSIYVRRPENGFAYVSQEVWIQSGTVKDNILFGSPLDIDRYQAVLDACALVEDLEKLPFGDMTEIGERAVKLSGGQKARLALARAVYKKKKIYLLDHALSRVDSHISHHIFENCFRGLLTNSTRILCTHQMSLLFQADYVYVMKDGKIVDKGSPAAIFEKKVHLTSSMMSSLTCFDLELKQTKNVYISDERDSLRRLSSHLPSNPSEESIEGELKNRVYKFYWFAVGKFLALVILTSLTLMQMSKNATDWWLAYWLAQYSSDENGTRLRITHTSAMAMQPNVPAFKDEHSYNVYVYRAISMVTNYENLDEYVCHKKLPVDEDSSFFITYTVLIVINSILALLRAFSFARGGLVAAVNIHDNLLYQLLKAPMNFFHKTPVGRILNRFSTDIYAIDNTLPLTLNMFLTQAFGLIGILLISCYGLPWIFIAILPLSLFYLKIQNNYRQTSREVKRISLTTLSCLYAHFSETFSGLITIRAFKAEKRLIEDNLAYLEKSQRAIYAIQIAGIWLALRLHLIGVVIVTGIAVLAVLQSNSHNVQLRNLATFLAISDHLINKAIICLTMTYALAITNLLNNLVWSFTELEKEMVSCERLLNYCENVGSENWQGTISPSEDWPSSGRISFDNVSLQYENQSFPALRGINLQIFPGEKIGIVGRSGSGKSSLFSAIFRLEELLTGKIVIDGMDISNLDLTILRSRLAIIPQDPFIFSGTVRDNLDPNSNYTNYELWTVLDKCHVIDAVHRIGGLDFPIREVEKDFSTGQKQLLCLARALLNNSQILCIDEVTANVDHDTDLMIHKTIDELFKERTVIIIAHRIESVLNCTRVVVLSRGEIIEEDNPQKLLSQSSSEFYRLASRVLNSYSQTVLKPPGRSKVSNISVY